MRAWWSRKTLEQRRAHVARRDPERVAAAERARSGSPARRNSIKRSHARHPEHVRAREIVANAVKRGRLERQPCHCGATRVEAHHPDYSQPLLVEWLCRTHHVARHAA